MLLIRSIKLIASLEELIASLEKFRRIKRDLAKRRDIYR